MQTLIDSALKEHRVARGSEIRRRIILLLNLTPPLLLWQTGFVVWWAWLYALVVHHLLLAGLFFSRCNWLGPVLTHLPTDQKLVWLTIDDGPSEDTISLAEMLAGMNISATFFLIGENISKYPEALEALRQNGHKVANHTEHHLPSRFWMFPPWKVAREIDRVFNTTIAQADSFIRPAFRCPVGIKNPFLHGILRRRGLTLVGWSVRAFDGYRCRHEHSLKEVLTNLHPGAILLTHEGKCDPAGKPASVELIRALVLRIREAGYEFTR